MAFTTPTAVGEQITEGGLVYEAQMVGGGLTWVAIPAAAGADISTDADLNNDPTKVADRALLRTHLDTKQNNTDLVTSIRDAATSEDTKYVSEKGIRDALDNVTVTPETSIRDAATSEDTKIVSEKAIRTELDTKQDTITPQTEVRDAANATDADISTEKAVRIELDTKQDVSELVTAIRDAATAEDTKYATEKAIRTALDSIDITGVFVGPASPTFAGLPAEASNGDWTVLSADDGANSKGIYISDGTNWSLLKTIEDFAVLTDAQTEDGTSTVSGTVTGEQLNKFFEGKIVSADSASDALTKTVKDTNYIFIENGGGIYHNKSGSDKLFDPTPAAGFVRVDNILVEVVSPNFDDTDVNHAIPGLVSAQTLEAWYVSKQTEAAPYIEPNLTGADAGTLKLNFNGIHVVNDSMNAAVGGNGELFMPEPPTDGNGDALDSEEIFIEMRSDNVINWTLEDQFGVTFQKADGSGVATILTLPAGTTWGIKLSAAESRWIYREVLTANAIDNSSELDDITEWTSGETGLLRGQLRKFMNGSTTEVYSRIADGNDAGGAAPGADWEDITSHLSEHITLISAAGAGGGFNALMGSPTPTRYEVIGDGLPLNIGYPPDTSDDKGRSEVYNNSNVVVTIAGVAVQPGGGAIISAHGQTSPLVTPFGGTIQTGAAVERDVIQANRGSTMSFGDLQFRVPSSGNSSLQMRMPSGSVSISEFTTKWSNQQGGASENPFGFTLNTSWRYFRSNGALNLTLHNSYQDGTFVCNGWVYHVQVIVGSGWNSNRFSFTRWRQAGIKGNDGADGVDSASIDHISLTTGDSSPGTTDTYTLWADAAEATSLGTYDVPIPAAIGMQTVELGSYSGSSTTGRTLSLAGGRTWQDVLDEFQFVYVNVGGNNLFSHDQSRQWHVSDINVQNRDMAITDYQTHGSNSYHYRMRVPAGNQTTVLIDNDGSTMSVQRIKVIGVK